ncbi:MAG: ABC-F family ATP-binding cassette domain-containing protein [Muribaculaceae bacterium]|nr:ABC-F family ATP-binding cassette domain-containing protein [Muribaculaceae bacterium]
MVSYLQIENLSKSYGDRILFSEVTFGVYQGDKIGIIATNGTGKTTFLNIIAGKEDFDSGKIVYRNNLRIGYLSQIPDFNPEESILEYVLSEHKNDNEDFSIHDRAIKFLTQFQITDHAGKMAVLSGGQLKRVALAKTLVSQPDLLILDEPTNHLDIEMVEWLENYLSKSNVTLLMVTHDRYFLDNVCNKIIEIDRKGFYFYEGNYDYYLEKREQRYEALNAELLKVKNLLRTELEWMRRQPQARGSKAKYRIDNFYQLEEKSKTNLSQRQLNLGNGGGYIGSKIFEAKNVSKSFGPVKILEDFNYTFARHEKLGIIGENGAGKTTFLKLLLGEIIPDSGVFDIGSTVNWGYYSQDGIVDFNPDKKVIDAVREIAEEVRIDDKTRLSASQFLNRFLFTPDDQQKFIAKLSGGERRRLYLATVLMRNPNFLILDEPTNDLDILTLSILEDYLSDFKGCVIIVSHDRFFLDRIVDHIFVFEGNGRIKDFPGNYSNYREDKKARESFKVSQSQDRGKISGEKDKTQSEPKKKTKLSFKERKELEEINSLLPVLEKEKMELEEKMSSGTLDHTAIMQAAQRIQEIISEIDEKEMRALELMEFE